MSSKSPPAERINVDHIIDLAGEIFAEHGFTGVGMRELSQRCKVSPPTLYYYFGSKESLFAEACKTRYQRAINRAAQAAASAKPGDGLVRLCETLFDLLTTDRTLFLLLRRDLIQGSVAGANFLSRPQYEALIELIANTVSQQARPSDGRELAFSLAALVFGYCELAHASHAGGQPLSLQARRSKMIYAVEALIRGFTGSYL